MGKVSMEYPGIFYNINMINWNILRSNNHDLVNKMAEKIQQYEDFLTTYGSIKNFLSLDVFHKQWSQSIKPIMDSIKHLTVEEKKIIAPIIMGQKKILEDFFEQQKIEYKAHQTRMEDEQPINKYIYTHDENYGIDHPINKTLLRLMAIMNSLGFSFKNDPLMVTEKQNFDDLNFLENHSARDMQDTFFLNNGKILRTHTSSTQIRVLKENTAPIKFFSMGQVFRNESVDATHNSMFHQMEVVYINEDANILSLRWTMEEILKKFFQQEAIKIRFRSSFFPFVTPGFEVDFWYKDRWLEIAGCGIIHPKVMDQLKENPHNYKGFAMGFGIDRLHMIQYQLNDIRDLYVHQSHLYGHHQYKGGFNWSM
jgi:phenylalanyl-tRNA synthetase alpha chain